MEICREGLHALSPVLETLKGQQICPSSHLPLTALRPTCVLTPGSGVHFRRVLGSKFGSSFRRLKNQNELYRREAFVVLSPRGAE